MAALLPLALLAGCDGGEPGTPTATNTDAPTSTPAATPSNAAGKAPRVANPLDASAFVKDPCKSLSDAQQDEFAMDDGKLDAKASDPICSWRSGPSKVSIGVWFVAEHADGLSNVYALKNSGYWDKGYFQPAEVSGYTAVFVDTNDGRDEGMCVLSVGVRDELYFTVHVGTNEQGEDGCVAAENVAAAVIETIKGGA